MTELGSLVATGAVRPLNPRARGREAALVEIHRLAWEQLGEGGAGALSLRDIARSMGLVSSGIYRYYDSRDLLLTTLVQQSYNGLGEAVELADAAHDAEDTISRWRSFATSLRAWAIQHRAHYALIYGSPVPGYHAPAGTVPAGTRTTNVLLDVIAKGWAAGRLAPQEPRVTPLPRLTGSLQQRLSEFEPPPPEPTVVAGITAWTTLHGLVAFEVFDHLAPVLEDPGEQYASVVEQLYVSMGGAPGDIRA